MSHAQSCWIGNTVPDWRYEALPGTLHPDLVARGDRALCCPGCALHIVVPHGHTLVPPHKLLGYSYRNAAIQRALHEAANHDAHPPPKTQLALF